MDTFGGNDVYQERYLAHQQRKKDILIELMEERHSERMFSEASVSDEIIKELTEVKLITPSSCDRKGIHVVVETDRDRKSLLGGLLVGGVGWIHRAPVVLLFFADPIAYKAGIEINWNPYLDTGFLAQNVYLLTTTLGLRGCFVNPQVRDFNQQYFLSVFSPLFGFEEDATDWTTGLYCGAMAIGWPREHRNSDSSS